MKDLHREFRVEMEGKGTYRKKESEFAGRRKDRVSYAELLGEE